MNSARSGPLELAGLVWPINSSSYIDVSAILLSVHRKRRFNARAAEQADSVPQAGRGDR